MKPILDRSGKVIGYTNEVGDRREVRNRSAGLIAWYDKRQDKTFKRDCSMAGFGDQAIKFLKEERQAALFATESRCDDRISYL
jgi:hypothetical protein